MRDGPWWGWSLPRPVKVAFDSCARPSDEGEPRRAKVKDMYAYLIRDVSGSAWVRALEYEGHLLSSLPGLHAPCDLLCKSDGERLLQDHIRTRVAEGMRDGVAAAALHDTLMERVRACLREVEANPDMDDTGPMRDGLLNFRVLTADAEIAWEVVRDRLGGDRPRRSYRSRVVADQATEDFSAEGG